MTQRPGVTIACPPGGIFYNPTSFTQFHSALPALVVFKFLWMSFDGSGSLAIDTSVVEANMNPKSNLDFKLMSLVYKFHDFVRPRRSILDEVGIGEEFCVLDYVCAPGSYVVLPAELVGKSRYVHASDINTLLIQTVHRLVSTKALNNVPYHTPTAEAEISP